MRPPKQTSIWTTCDGVRMRICDMTDTHLINTINMLARTAPDRYTKALALAVQFGATFAEDDWCIDHVAEQSDLELLQELIPIFKDMLWDFSRRDLSIELLARGEEIFEQCYLALYTTDVY